MIMAILAVVFAWFLFYGQIPPPFLVLFCFLLGAFLAYFSRHKHSNVLSVDVMAQGSRLKDVHPMLKFWTLLALIMLCIASQNIFTGVFLFVAMLILAVFVGGLSLHSYIQILVLPISFLLISGFALLFQVSSEPTGIMNFQVFRFWLSVSAKSQAHTALIVSRALGAVSCLCLLSITTPMPDIIGVLRRVHCPELIIDLMYLIYRYIFILLSLYHEMHNATTSRLGFRDYRTSLRSTGNILSNLLARSYQFAGKNFDAMESRCYDTGIRFIERRASISLVQIVVSASLLLVSLYLILLPL